MVRRTSFIFGLMGWLAIAAAGQTLSPQRLLGRYQQFIWTDQHGLPQNGVSAIVQTPDGYLWFAIAEGVVRFDGVHFTAFDTGNTPGLKSNNVQALLVDRQGVLWVGTHGGGLSRYAAGRFTNYSIAEGLSDNHIKSLYEDRAGNLWIGTDGGGLNKLGRDGRFTAYGVREGLPDSHVWTILEDAVGALWLGTDGGLVQFKEGHFTVFRMADGLPSNAVRALCLDRTGELWIGLNPGVSRLSVERQINLKPSDLPEGLRRQGFGSIYQERGGTLWFGTIGGGLYRLQAGHFDNCNSSQGLASDAIQALYEDPGGDLWVGTSGSGIIQLRAGRFGVYTTAEGLPHDMVNALQIDAAGGLWIGTQTGLSRLADGHLTTLLRPSGQPWREINGISLDRAGRLWLNSSDRAIGRHIVRWTPGQNILHDAEVENSEFRGGQMLQTRSGQLWLSQSYQGVVLWRDGQRTHYRKQDGLADDYVTNLFEDREGGVWVGTRNGVSRFADNRWRTWTSREGFAGQHILSFHQDATGAVWIGTHGYGLYRYKDGQFRVITSQQGLYDNLAFQILEDASGNLWMSGNKGIYRASLKELHECADGLRTTVSSFAYGVADGMLSRECNGGHTAGVKTPDGRLWFPTIRGVVAVDPQRINREPPRVVIEQATLDGAPLPLEQTARIRVEQERLEIQYTALSWSRPQQVRFKYQLVGLEQAWTDAGTRRTAYYPHLPPGSYVFRVIADNGEGVWNETGASFRFVVVPPFYRTGWFAGLVLLGVAGVAWLGYRLRVQQLERANAAQQEFSRRLLNAHEGERQRIAAELHDGLSQSLAIIRQRATICLQAQGDAERQQEQMEEIAEAATAVIDEVRDIIYDLRPVQLDRLGLTNSLREMLEKVGRAHGLTIEHELDDLAGRLPKESENSLYRIVQEAVNNIVRHAQARRATVQLKLQADGLRLVVADDGRGFIPDATRDWVRGSGLGLTGIHERTRLLQGQLLVESAPQQGTTLTILLPLPESPK